MVSCKYTANRIVPIASFDSDLLENDSKMFSFLLITKGVAVLRLNGQLCYISAGNLLCLSPRDKMELLKAYDLFIRVLRFGAEFINPLLQDELVFSSKYSLLCQKYHYPLLSPVTVRNLTYIGILPLNEQQRSYFETWLLRVQSQIEGQPDQYWSCRARDYVLRILEAAEYALRRFQPEKAVYDPLVIEMIEYIHLHIHDHITTESLCKIFHTNHTSLVEKFKRATGRTIKGYIEDKRLELICQSLSFTELGIEELADSYGFYDAAHLCKSLKKKMGCSPIQYRKSARQQRANGTNRVVLTDASNS